MKKLSIRTSKWIGALAVIPALVLLSACEPRNDDPMVTDPDQERDTEWGAPDRDMDRPQRQPADPAQDPAQDPALEQEQRPADDPVF